MVHRTQRVQFTLRTSPQAIWNNTLLKEYTLSIEISIPLGDVRTLATTLTKLKTKRFWLLEEKTIIEFSRDSLETTVVWIKKSKNFQKIIPEVDLEIR